ncbi:MAG: reverse transcriptase domain-containing protein [Kiritimatiellia bacterium]
MSLRTETAYKADRTGELAQHSKAQGSTRENMLQAWKRVKANKGAAGIDEMSIEQFPEFARQYWERIRSALIEGAYRPAAVLRVLIPKATGGQRPLGIPTVLDRVIQQAIAQVITPLFESQFSAHSYGFRPKRNARMALTVMEDAYSNGLRYAVDCDLKSFFDTVNRLWQQGVPNMRQQWIELHYGNAATPASS